MMLDTEPSPSKFVTLNEVNERLSKLDEVSTSTAPLAKFPDYFDKLGGVPKIEEQANGFTTISHEYDPNGLIVRSHKSIEDYGVVSYLVPDENAKLKQKLFAVALVTDLHGNPCQAESFKSGGHGYDKVNK